MSPDEITTFREARPEATPYDPGARARLRARLVDEATARAPRAHPLSGARRRIVTVGVLTAALVAGITVVQNIDLSGRPAGNHATPGETRRPVLLGPVANAEDLAQAAALQAAAEPDARPRPDQWSYAKTVLAISSKGTGGVLFGPPDKRLTVERWRRADGKQSATIENGRLEIRNLSAMEQNASPRSDYPYLLSLPDDADALLDHVYKVVDSESGQKASDKERADRAFQIIEVFMRDSALPSRLRAAMYGALAKIPGVRYEAKAADIQGRPGVTLYRIVEGYLRSEIIVNPKTYEYMGFRFIAIKNHDSQGLDGDLHSKKGQILGWGGLIKAAIVDRPGQRA
jgi:hypothetical protein